MKLTKILNIFLLINILFLNGCFSLATKGLWKNKYKYSTDQVVQSNPVEIYKRNKNVDSETFLPEYAIHYNVEEAKNLPGKTILSPKYLTGYTLIDEKYLVFPEYHAHFNTFKSIVNNKENLQITSIKASKEPKKILFRVTFQPPEEDIKLALITDTVADLDISNNYSPITSLSEKLELQVDIKKKKEPVYKYPLPIRIIGTPIALAYDIIIFPISILVLTVFGIPPPM